MKMRDRHRETQAGEFRFMAYWEEKEISAGQKAICRSCWCWVHSDSAEDHWPCEEGSGWSFWKTNLNVMGFFERCVLKFSVAASQGPVETEPCLSKASGLDFHIAIDQIVSFNPIIFLNHPLFFFVPPVLGCPELTRFLMALDFQYLLALNVVLGQDVFVHRAQVEGNIILVDINKCLLTLGKSILQNFVLITFLST